MNTHKNARLTLARRLETVQDITERGQSVPDTAVRHGVTAPTARKWLGRYLAGGAAALAVKAAKISASDAGVSIAAPTAWKARAPISKSTAHHWARRFQSLGVEVKLIRPQYVCPLL